MSQEQQVRAAFARQASWCAQLGSPFTGLLMECLENVLDHTSKTGSTVLNWRGDADALGDAVPLRLAGGLHGLVRRGRLPELAALYPPAAVPDRQRLSDLLVLTIAEADAELAQWLNFPPQTNEVARSSVLYAGLNVIAKETGLPLSLFEIGASAGLNLFSDKYAYALNGTLFGCPGSKVRLTPRWQGAVPTGPDPVVARRCGCDKNPLDVADAAHRERLIAYVWPDQAERLERVQAAIEIARAAPPRLDVADAADWVDERFSAPPDTGTARVLFHTIAYQYFAETAKTRIAARMEAAGAGATGSKPLAWLSFEQFENEGPRLTLRIWPGGEARVLAHADAHCRKVRWFG